jgi:hypothetical protein
MKSLKFILVCWLCLASGLPLAAFAGQEGHGGDMAVSLFLGIARKNFACLKENPKFWQNEPSLLDDLKRAYDQTEVISVERTVLNDVEVDAINYPSPEKPRILINRSRWLVSGIDIKYRSLLVIHEYLSIAGYDDHVYQISYDLIEKNSPCLSLEDL